MKTADFDFDLPARLIAQRPAQPRDSARLLVVGEDVRDAGIADLPGLLEPGDILVFNDTRVIPARLAGHRGDAGVEVTLHRREADGAWRAFAQPARRLRPGDRIDFGPGFAAHVSEKGEGGEVTLDFSHFAPMNDADLMRALDEHGAMPLPPYIKRPAADRRDRTDYQTLFARRDGAVAAPTAALHFTPALMEALAARQEAHVFLTLHVGAGTFLPVKTEDTADHRMHAERGMLSATAARAINAAREAGGRVVAVGSTALRLLETAADDQGRLAPFEGETDIFITPGYRFKAVDRLLTNFHLPRSTLFMLVAAFAGLNQMKAAYDHAKEAGYRFYSYGDACLLDRREAP